MRGALVLRPPPPHSQVSEKAFDVIVNLAKAAGGSKVYVLHVFPRNWASEAGVRGPDYHKNEFESRGRKADVEVFWRQAEEEEDRSVCDLVKEMAENSRIHFVAMGSFGQSNTGEGDAIEVLGSMADSALRSMHSSNVIVKSSSFELEEQRTFVFATDHSDAAQAAFAIFCHNVIQAGDICHVVYTSKVVEKTTILAAYENELSKKDVDEKSRCALVKINEDDNVADQICQFARKCQADFLVLGVSGYNKAKLGSVSEAAVKTATCTVIVVKDPTESWSHLDPPQATF